MEKYYLCKLEDDYYLGYTYKLDYNPYGEEINYYLLDQISQFKKFVKKYFVDIGKPIRKII